MAHSIATAAAVGLLFTIAAPFCRPVAAQTLKIRLINGKSSKPMGNRRITVKSVTDLESSVIVVDDRGVGVLPLTPGTQEFLLLGGPKSDSEPYRIAYIDPMIPRCDESKLQMCRQTDTSPEIHVDTTQPRRAQGRLCFGHDPCHGGYPICSRFYRHQETRRSETSTAALKRSLPAPAPDPQHPSASEPQSPAKPPAPRASPDNP